MRIPGIYILILLAASVVLAFVLEPEVRMPGIYILALLAAAVILAFVLELVAFLRDPVPVPVPASGDEPSAQKLDRRVLLRLAAVGTAAAVAVAAAIITGYSVDPQRTSLLLAWPRDHHPAALLLVGVVLCLVALVCGVKLRQPVLLFCLTLPGLVIMPLLLLAAIGESINVAEAALGYTFVFFIEPGVWILMFIAIGQARLLRQPGGNFSPGGLVRVCLISIAYTYGFIT